MSSEYDKPMRFSDGALLCLLLAMVGVGGDYVVFQTLLNETTAIVIVFEATYFVIVFLFFAYFFLLSLVALNYRITAEGIEIYKRWKKRYFLPWSEVKSIGDYDCGLVISRLNSEDTKVLVPKAASGLNGPEITPWCFRREWINSACFFKKRLAYADECPLLLLTSTAFSTQRSINRKLARIRYFWVNGRGKNV